MLVKIQDKIFSSDTQPIAVKFSPGEIEILKAIAANPGHDVLVAGPQGTDGDALAAFANEGAAADAATSEPAAVSEISDD